MVKNTAWSSTAGAPAGGLGPREMVRHQPKEHAPVVRADRRYPASLTLGGYIAKRERAAAFEGRDGHAYSCAPDIEDEPDHRGLFGAALWFVRWDPTGHNPIGYVETEHLAWGRDPSDAQRRLSALSLFDVKAALDQAILDRPDGW